jgi:hypothetical protein
MYEDSTAVTNPCDALQPCITMQHTCQTHATSVDTCLAVCRSLLSAVDVEDISSRTINDGAGQRTRPYLRLRFVFLHRLYK